MLAMTIFAIAAPLVAGDPIVMHPIARFEPPSAAYWLGTDHLGRDVFARVAHGARISLVVGLAVAVISVVTGLVIGLIAGYVRRLESLIMRMMDGIMSVPSIMLAIALVALTEPSVLVVVVAITIPEVPRVVRLVRSVVLTARENLYVEAAIAGGSTTGRIIRRHILPVTLSPLIVQATYICASAILTEASLSFLGSGTPPDIPTWGNMIAVSKLYLTRAPWTIFFPGLALAITILAINMLGDGLRDRLDPRLARRI